MRAFTLIISCCLILSVSAQQVAQYTQYVFNHFSINPAIAGSKDCMEGRLGYRTQWVGFENAPRTGWASLHGTIKNKAKPFDRQKHGVGIFMETDEQGVLGYTSLYLAYAYHLPMGQNSMMSMGLFGGIKQFKMDVGEITVINFNDPLISSSASVTVAPEIAPGIWLYDNRKWVGLSMFHALGNRIDGVGEDTKWNPNTLFSAGLQFSVGRKTTTDTQYPVEIRSRCSASLRPERHARVR